MPHVHGVIWLKNEEKKKYIKDIQDNRRKLIEEKTSLIAGNEEEIFKKKRKIADLQDDIECMHEKISNASKVEEKFTKLKDIQSQLKEKYRAHNRLIGFFEKNEDCPTCQQHIDETFKSTMINKKKIEVNKLSKGMNDLKDELDATKAKVSTINEVNKNIQSNNVEIAKENSSMAQLQKFNATLDAEIKQLQSGHVDKKEGQELMITLLELGY